jgi:hypothetical protein
MCGTIGTARQASAGGHAGHTAASDRAAPIGGTARQPASAVQIPPLADPQGNDLTGRWPLRSFLELGALPSAVPCARLHTRHVLWDWRVPSLIDSTELLVSEIITNAVHISHQMDLSAVRLWLLCDRARVVVLAWDPSPLPPVPAAPDDDTENGRGLLLVEAISEQWGWYFPAGHGTANVPDQPGKVVWAVVGLSTKAARPDDRNGGSPVTTTRTSPRAQPHVANPF